MDFENARQTIKASPQLKELNLVHQGILLGLARVEKFSIEQTIFREGDQSTGSFLLLVSGRLNIQSSSGEVLRTADPGELVGEVGIINPSARRTKTVVAADTCEALVWDFSQLQKLAPEFAKELSGRLERVAFERISQSL